MIHKFPKRNRLLIRKEFQAMQGFHQKYVGTCIVIAIRENKRPVSRLGITASKKFGKSHQRNRFKRIVREAYRRNIPEIPLGVDLHVCPRAKALLASSSTVAEELKSAIRVYCSRLQVEQHHVQLA